MNLINSLNGYVATEFLCYERTAFVVAVVVVAVLLLLLLMNKIEKKWDEKE